MKKQMVLRALTAAMLASGWGLSGVAFAEGSASPGSATTLVSFAGAALSVDARHRNGVQDVLKGASLSEGDVRRLASEPIGHVVALIASDTMPLSSQESVALKRLVRAQVPVLVRMKGHALEDRQKVANLLGIAPAADMAIVRREVSGETSVFSPADEARADGDVLRSLRMALMDSVTDQAEAGSFLQRSLMSEPEVSFAPMRVYKFNFVSNDAGIGGFAKVEVVRAITRAGDRKVITVTSETDFAPFYGYEKADTPSIRFTLPTGYGISHGVTLDGKPVDNAGYLPKSDDRTEFSFTDTSSESSTIGGSVGSEVSASGKPDEKLGAKMSFSASASYTKTRTRALSMSFTDFSLAATSSTPGSVSWTANMAPRAYDYVVSGGGTGSMFWKVFHGSHHVWNAMTPMMRSAYMTGESTWSVSGSAEGIASISVIARQESKVFRNFGRSQPLEYRVLAGGDIALSDPYLTREITVLISSWSNGHCMADVQGVAQLMACDKDDARQMWRLDTNDRYVNHASRRCLTASSGAQPVLIKTCVLNANNQRWQWLADRLHLRGQISGDRLHVRGGAIQSSVAGLGIASYPINSHAAVLNPWPSYPSPPFPGELIPAPAHIMQASAIDPSWVNLPPVDNRQRWDVQPLRFGL